MNMGPLCRAEPGAGDARAAGGGLAAFERARVISPMRDDTSSGSSRSKDRAPHFADLLEGGPDMGRIRPHQARAELIDRPLGLAPFVAAVERRLATAQGGRSWRKY